MKPKNMLIGLGILIAGAVLSALGLPVAGAPLMGIGAILFTGVYGGRVLPDYWTLEGENYVMTMRMRHYIVPLLFLGLLRIHYKTEHKKVLCKDIQAQDPEMEEIAISAREYRELVAHQRQQYEAGTAPKDAVLAICEPAVQNFSKTKCKYILCIVLMCLCATMLSLMEPMAIAMTVVSESILLWLLLLWRPEYVEAKRKKVFFEQYREGVHK